MLPNIKPKKGKLKEKSKQKIKVTKDKIVKKSNMGIQKLKKNKLNRVGFVVEDAMIKMNDLTPKVLVKKKRTFKLELMAEGKEEEKEVGTNNHGYTNSNEIDHDTLDCGNKKLEKEKKHKTGLKKKRREKENVILASSEDQVYDNEDNDGDEINMLAHTNSDIGPKLKKKKKEKKEKKKKTKCPKKGIKRMHIVEAHNITDESDAEEISLVDEDCTRGMKKWLTQYKEKRPGLNILQQRIDDYITSYEERLEQERKEREVKLDEEGWTIVKHHKGRKKTTDAESGISVGAVAQAALVDKLSQKKSKEAPLNFYRHQKREEHRNEVMKLQSKFEQDKKRVQEMKAARKFRPY